MKLARISIGWIIAAAFIYLTFRGANANDIWAALGHVRPLYLTAAIALLGIDYFLRVARWRSMLVVFNSDAALKHAAGPLISSFALNNVFPFRAGDIARSFAFRDQIGVAPARVVGTLVLERALDLLGLLCFLFLGLTLTATGHVPAELMAIARWGAGIAIVALIGILTAPRRIAGALAGFSKTKLISQVPLARRVVRFVCNALFSIGWLRSPKVLTRLFALTLAAWGLEGTVFWTVLASGHVHVTGGGPWLVMAVGTLATLIPSTPGYVGTFDYFTKLGMISIGVPDADAAVLALIAHAILWLPVTLAGGMFLIMNWGELFFSRIRLYSGKRA